MNRSSWVVAAALWTAAFAASGATGAGTASPSGAVYEWVDSSGRLQASDTVPARYKGVARRVDASRYRIAPAEQQQADRQAATLKAQAASVSPRSQPAGATASAGTAPAASLSGPTRVPDTPECAAWRIQRAASEGCFIGFSNPDGTSGLRSCSNQPDPLESVCAAEGTR